LRDELNEQRRRLPWEIVTKEYASDGPDGRRTLAELFGACSQLVVYHLMFDPSWDAGCPHCSFGADNFNQNYYVSFTAEELAGTSHSVTHAKGWARRERPSAWSTARLGEAQRTRSAAPLVARGDRPTSSPLPSSLCGFDSRHPLPGRSRHYPGNERSV
jgi:hypothetical protein